MKFTKIIMALMAGVLCAPTIYAQSNNTTANTKVTAQLATSCQFTAQSVSFGTLMLPVTTQQATSQVQVLCTKGTAYDITMGTISNIYIMTNNGYGYGAFDSNTGQQVAMPANWQTTYTKTTTVAAGSRPDCYSIYGCDIYNTGGYGSMKGASKGDSISYKIKNPSDNSKDWNTTNKYNGIGIGAIQNIPVVAEIIPSQTTAFPAPDMYTDTVTAYLNF